MLSFTSDYTQGCCPEILSKLTALNYEMNAGYGEDEHSSRAVELIRSAIGKPKAGIRFLVGGTQTNQTVIATLLHSTEGVIAATSGHVNCHEAGAIEHSGHKVLTIPSYKGKIKAEDARQLLASFYADPSYPHMVFPGMIYISHPTEYGTLYTKSELEEIAAVCREYKIPLFLDGARLGYGLAAEETDVTIQTIADLVDVFYIGGTKVGALFGEAVVFPNGDMPKHFVTSIKQHGALLAKGWLTGLQFETLFTDDLYGRISKNAILQAKKVRKILLDAGFELFIDSPTNQQFFILDNRLLDALMEKVKFEIWEPVDADRTAVRFATSWATTDENIAELREIIASI